MWYKAITEGKLRAKVHRIQSCIYDWSAIQSFYDEGHTYQQCRSRFRFSPAAWTSAVQRRALTTRPRKPSVEWLMANSKSRASIKRRLLDAGLLRNECDECGISEWRGRYLSIQLDHRNGVKDDHRLENLRMLCPNCHSQTPTFGIRNRKQSVEQ
ncbi:MAG: HNH endonuclease [Candidatus Eremiobacteraeota bacterium]|nr:HNH endonuclease [Candidatus Eremiobacteraeota bacterium]